MDHLTFDSAVNADRLTINAPYYNAINPITVSFPQEKVSVLLNSLGHIEFFDADEQSIGFVDFPVHKDPSAYSHTAQYGTVECFANGSNITIYLPSYYWSDSYPHCDGESDRWSRHIDYWFRVVLDCESKKITVLDRDG